MHTYICICIYIYNVCIHIHLYILVKSTFGLTAGFKGQSKSGNNSRWEPNIFARGLIEITSVGVRCCFH